MPKLSQPGYSSVKSRPLFHLTIPWRFPDAKGNDDKARWLGASASKRHCSNTDSYRHKRAIENNQRAKLIAALSFAPNRDNSVGLSISVQEGGWLISSPRHLVYQERIGQTELYMSLPISGFRHGRHVQVPRKLNQACATALQTDPSFCGETTTSLST